MEAKITNREQKFTGSYRKDRGLTMALLAINNAGDVTVEARIYQPGSVAYCALWVHTPNAWHCGTGKAGGYGYHKPSAALGEAVINAGYDLSDPIYGRGRGAMVEAVEALAVLTAGHCLKVLEVYP